MHLCHMCTFGGHKKAPDHVELELVLDGCESTCGWWQLNLGPLLEQQVFWIPKPPLQPLYIIFLKIAYSLDILKIHSAYCLLNVFLIHFTFKTIIDRERIDIVILRFCVHLLLLCPSFPLHILLSFLDFLVVCFQFLLIFLCIFHMYVYDIHTLFVLTIAIIQRILKAESIISNFQLKFCPKQKFFSYTITLTLHTKNYF